MTGVRQFFLKSDPFDKMTQEISFLIALIPTNIFPALGLRPVPQAATVLGQEIYCNRSVCREFGF
jgi:hypothetical protein